MKLVLLGWRRGEWVRFRQAGNCFIFLEFGVKIGFVLKLSVV